MQTGSALTETDDVARRGVILERTVKLYQDAITSLELCNKPILTLSHGACVGAGVDFITAADIRYATQDCFFEVKEVDIGMAADVGTLQRLPKVIGSQSLARELCLTGRRLKSDEALSCGLLSQVFANRDLGLEQVLNTAQVIAEKSPIAVQATKENMVYSFNRQNQDGLDHIVRFDFNFVTIGVFIAYFFQRILNKLYLQSDDFVNATMAQLTKGQKPIFAKL